MAGQDNGSRISVSEDKLRLLFAEFKLELVKELTAYATVASVEKWQGEISKVVGDLDKRLRVVEDNQAGNLAVSRVQKMWLGFGAAFVTAVVSALIYLAFSGGHG